MSYELVVIGGGAAGSGAATRAAAAGRRVALVERDRLGGTCLNYGCDPTKTILRSAHLLYHARHAARHGLEIPEARADWGAIRARVEEVQRAIRGGDHDEARTSIEEQGIDLFMAEARFLAPHELAVGARRIEAERVIIATGGEPRVPPIEGLAEAGYLTNRGAVTLPELPDRLAVVGGGPIGIEFAQMFHRLGVEVTLLEEGPQLLARDDRVLADRLCALLAEEGITLHVGVRARGAQCERVEGGRRLRFGSEAGPDKEIIVDHILLATGRRPVIDALDLDAAGVAYDERGITAGPTGQTSVEHIWAVGDVTGGYQFTHVAATQGRLAADNAFAEEPIPFDPAVIPWVTFTDPALAHVGPTAEELDARGLDHEVRELALDSLDRAIIEGETAGMVRLLVGEGGRLLGGHVLAPNAGELAAPLVLAVGAGMPAATLADSLFPYPTFAEALRWAAAG